MLTLRELTIRHYFYGGLRVPTLREPTLGLRVPTLKEPILGLRVLTLGLRELAIVLRKLTQDVI